MYKSIYITATEPRTGKSLISLGIMEWLLRLTPRVAVFRPIITDAPEGGRDPNIDLLLKHFNLNIPYEDTYAFKAYEAIDLLAHREVDELINRVIKKYKKLEDQYDYVVCIGKDMSDEGLAFEFDADVAIAHAIGSPVIILTGAAGCDLDEVLSTLHRAVDAFTDRGCPVLGVGVNRVDPEEVIHTREALEEALPDEICVSAIPENDLLGSPTLKEIANHLGADTLFGEDRMDHLVTRYMVVAMHMQNYLPRLKENALLITPGDRGEVILSAIAANRSSNYPPLAGLLLTTGERPAPSVEKVLDGLPINRLPILAVESETYETVSKISSVRTYITAESPAKIAVCQKLFNEFVDAECLQNRFGRIEPRGVSPRMFLYSLIQRAQADKKHIVLPEGEDERILQAAAHLVDLDVVDITLIGREDLIHRKLARRRIDLDLDKVSIIQPENHPKFEAYAQKYTELRQHRGITMDFSRDAMRGVSYFGTMMVYMGDADGMVSGAVHSTAHTIRPAFQFVKTKPGVSVVSSVFFMLLEDRVLVYGDCAVVPRPDAEQLADIAIASAETGKAFGIEPKVAMLSYSSGESGTGEEVDRVRTATQLARERRPDLPIEGPIQYDAAVDMSVGASKMPGSKVAGRASVLIFPDLNTGNNTYKAVQRETGAIAVGPVLQGLNKPVNDLSRGCTVDDIINTIAITAIQAQNK